MFSPYPNKQRGQAFSPASSASSPAPSLAASLSRQAQQQQQSQQHHSRTGSSEFKPAEATAPPLSASTSKTSNASRSASRKARPLFDPHARPNISFVSLPDTTSTTPGWAVRWIKYTYASAANTDDAAPTLHPTSDTSPAQEPVVDAPPQRKRPRLEEPALRATEATRHPTAAAWLRACATSSSNSDNPDDFSDAIEKARRCIEATIHAMRLEQQREVAFDEDPFGPTRLIDFEDGEVGESTGVAAAEASAVGERPGSASIDTPKIVSSPVITLNSDDRASRQPATGVAPRSCLVQTQPGKESVSRCLWLFELDERRCALHPLPESFEDLEAVDSGLITFASLYPSLVDKNTGYPLPLSASNAPSTLDLTCMDASTPVRGALSAFFTSVQHDLASFLATHHDLDNVEVRTCGRDLLLFPPREQLQLSASQPQSAVALNTLVTLRWEGLVVRALRQHVPWCLPPADRDLQPGNKLRLCPVGIEAAFKRWVARKDKANESIDAADRQLIESTKARFRQEMPRLMQDRPLDSWVLVSWQDQDVLWPWDLVLVESPCPPPKPPPQPLKQPFTTISNIAVASGQYVDGLVKDREQRRANPAEAANAPKAETSPNNDSTSGTPNGAEVSMASAVPVKSPAVSGPAASPAAATSLPARPQAAEVESPDTTQTNASTFEPQSLGFDGASIGKSDRAGISSSGWDGFGDDNDHDGAFDDVLTGLTADDFSFFDAPALPHGAGASTDISAPHSATAFNAFDQSVNLGSNLFGDLSSNAGFFPPSPHPNFSHSPSTQSVGPSVDHPTPDLNGLMPKFAPDQANGFANSSEVSEQTAVSPNFSTLFGPSPAAANSPYKTPFTPFSTEDPSPPGPAAVATVTSNTTGTPSLTLPTGPTPFAQSQPQWRFANDDRFGPLSFSASVTPVSTQPIRDLSIAEDVENQRPFKAAKRCRNYSKPLPWKSDVRASLARSRLRPTVIPLKRILQAEAEDSESESEDLLASAIVQTSNRPTQEQRQRQATSSLLLGVHLLALRDCASGSLVAAPSRANNDTSPKSVFPSRLAPILLECPAFNLRRTTPRLSAASAGWIEDTPTVKLPSATTEPLMVLERPRIRTVRGDSVVDADLAALDLWSKAAFRPLSGTKDVHAVVLSEAGLGEQAQSCLQALSIAYTAANLGEHASEQANFDFRLERPVSPSLIARFSDMLSKIVKKDRRLVCYVPTDLASDELAILSEAVAKHEQLVSIHPISALCKDTPTTITAHQATCAARAVYDHFRRRPGPSKNSNGSAQPSPLPSQLQPNATREQMLESLQGGHPGAYAPHFTLAPRPYDPPAFSLKWPAPSLEVLDRHRFLHVSYAVDSDAKELLLIVCDDRGETHLVETIPLMTHQEQERVGKVWLFLHALLRKSSVEWRVVISFVSEPHRLTLECWRACLGKILSDAPFACHFSLVLLQDHDQHSVLEDGITNELVRIVHTPHGLEAPYSHGDEDDGSLFQPASDLFLACSLLLHTPSPVRPQEPASAFQSIASAFFYASSDQESASPSARPAFTCHLLHMAHSPSSLLRRSLDQHMADLATSFSDLVHLGRARQFSGSVLPFHTEFLSACFLGKGAV